METDNEVTLAPWELGLVNVADLVLDQAFMGIAYPISGRTIANATRG